jgi:CheY-like chemotaxis protein
VLVVEDDDGIRACLDTLLTDEGYEVAHATGGLRALELLHAWTDPAVVLFDFSMPDGDGLDLLRTVAKDGDIACRYAYICMAARDRHRFPAEFTALMDRHRVAFVSKPFGVEEVLAAVAAARRRLRA